MLDTKFLLQELSAELNDAEQKRQYHYRRVRPFKIAFNLGMISALLFIVYAIIVPDDGATSSSIAGGIFMLCLVIYGVKHSYEHGQYKDYFQRNVVSKIIPHLGPGFIYESRGGFTQQRLEESYLFSYFNACHSEDFVSGRIEGRSISFAEVKLELLSGSDSTKTRTAFKGMYLEIQLSQQFAAPCWLVRKKKRLSENDQAEIVKLNESTSKSLGKYRLYSENAAFAQQLFSVEVINKLLTVDEDLRARKVIWGHARFAFIGNTIRIALSIRKRFMEPELSSPVTTEAFLQQELALLEECTKLVNLV
ncbi:DUF3137 domain-containing protein [Marinoscillum sp.]|uniref:DUF3137 domain-containing protein n=1 Tax=Marinoscillum sp. TaxID=2024838 RepID=UPI003BA99A40